MSSGKQNACSYGAGTKHSILHSHCQTLQLTLPPSLKLGCLFFSLLSSRAENFSPQIKEGIIANMAEIPTLIPILCVCVCVCDSCTQAMKKTIVVVPLCLISVYTTMSVVLWSPLVRLFVGLHCEPSGNAEGSPCVCVSASCTSVLSETHISIPVCLVAVSSSCHPRAQRLGRLLIYGGSRIGWRCCPVCQPGVRGVEFSPVVYFMPFNNLNFMSLSTGPGPVFLSCSSGLGFPKVPEGSLLTFIQESAWVTQITLVLPKRLCKKMQFSLIIPAFSIKDYLFSVKSDKKTVNVSWSKVIFTGLNLIFRMKNHFSCH